MRLIGHHDLDGFGNGGEGIPARVSATARRHRSATSAWTRGTARTTPTSTRRPDPCYAGYIDDGLVFLDISDRTNSKQIGRLDYHPPATGFAHTTLPL